MHAPLWLCLPWQREKGCATCGRAPSPSATRLGDVTCLECLRGIQQAALRESVRQAKLASEATDVLERERRKRGPRG